MICHNHVTYIYLHLRNTGHARKDHEYPRTVGLLSHQGLEYPSSSILVVRIDLQVAGVPGQLSRGSLLKGDTSVLESSAVESERGSILEAFQGHGRIRSKCLHIMTRLKRSPASRKLSQSKFRSRNLPQPLYSKNIMSPPLEEKSRGGAVVITPDLVS